MTTTRIDLSTLSIILLCQAFMDQATRRGTRNPIPWLARCERITQEECDGNKEISLRRIT